MRRSDPHIAAMFRVFGRLYAKPSEHHTGLQPRCTLAQAHTDRLMTAHPVEVEARSESPPQRGGSPSSSSFLGSRRLARRVLRGEHVTAARRDPQPQRYQARVRGRLGETIRCAFPDLQARTRGDDTVLTGVFADQAALYGVLAEIEALGLELIDVRRLPPH